MVPHDDRPADDESARVGRGEVRMNERTFPATQAQRLEDPERLVWLPPADVLSALKIQSGMTVADIGAGTGYFSLPLAAALGSSGRVYAVDAQDEMLRWIATKIEKNSATGRAALAEIVLVHADATATTLPEASCDLYWCANVWHELGNRAEALAEARRVLKPGGRLAILDWRPDVERIAGPPLDHRISTGEVKQEIENSGFLDVSIGCVGLYSWLVQADSSASN